MCGHVFRRLTMSSRAALEVVAAESDALLPFLGGSRPLLHDSGEKSRGPTFFDRALARCFCDGTRFLKRAKSTKKRYKSQKFDFARLECACDFMDRLETLEAFLL